jgi:hypothetical protein
MCRAGRLVEVANQDDPARPGVTPIQIQRSGRVRRPAADDSQVSSRRALMFPPVSAETRVPTW